MVYELGTDARSFFESSTSVGVFTYVRHYQYIILLNSRTPALRATAVRRALNRAIDRNALVLDALDGHGVPSSGPLSSQHWSVRGNLPPITFDPAGSADVLSRTPVKFRCLVASDDERIALVVKRQLEAVGVEMTVEEGSIEHNVQSVMNGEFEAVLWAAFSGPNLFRPYFWWHSGGYFNWGAFASRAVDAALDTSRRATSDDDYGSGVVRFQQAILDDPPAIFLAWDERARAVSRRFEVPAEPGVDILGTLRSWRPVDAATN
jgi:ABC-type transport system substrate-binding protein